jgi:hypothetical protein
MPAELITSNKRLKISHQDIAKQNQKRVQFKNFLIDVQEIIQARPDLTTSVHELIKTFSSTWTTGGFTDNFHSVHDLMDEIQTAHNRSEYTLNITNFSTKTAKLTVQITSWNSKLITTIFRGQIPCMTVIDTNPTTVGAYIQHLARATQAANQLRFHSERITIFMDHPNAFKLLHVAALDTLPHLNNFKLTISALSYVQTQILTDAVQLRLTNQALPNMWLLNTHQNCRLSEHTFKLKLPVNKNTQPYLLRAPGDMLTLRYPDMLTFMRLLLTNNLNAYQFLKTMILLEHKETKSTASTVKFFKHLQELDLIGIHNELPAHQHILDKRLLGHISATYEQKAEKLRKSLTSTLHKYHCILTAVNSEAQNACNMIRHSGIPQQTLLNHADDNMLTDWDSVLQPLRVIFNAIQVLTTKATDSQNQAKTNEIQIHQLHRLTNIDSDRVLSYDYKGCNSTDNTQTSTNPNFHESRPNDAWTSPKGWGTSPLKKEVVWNNTRNIRKDQIKQNFTSAQLECMIGCTDYSPTYETKAVTTETRHTHTNAIHGARANYITRSIPDNHKCSKCNIKYRPPAITSQLTKYNYRGISYSYHPLVSCIICDRHYCQHCINPQNYEIDDCECRQLSDQYRKHTDKNQMRYMQPFPAQQWDTFHKFIIAMLQQVNIATSPHLLRDSSTRYYPTYEQAHRVPICNDVENVEYLNTESDSDNDWNHANY